MGGKGRGEKRERKRLAKRVGKERKRKGGLERDGKGKIGEMSKVGRKGTKEGAEMKGKEIAWSGTARTRALIVKNIDNGNDSVNHKRYSSDNKSEDLKYERRC